VGAGRTIAATCGSRASPIAAGYDRGKPELSDPFETAER
jgi:hypothetical protein